jgi:hypothetical protein
MYNGEIIEELTDQVLEDHSTPTRNSWSIHYRRNDMYIITNGTIVLEDTLLENAALLVEGNISKNHVAV